MATQDLARRDRLITGASVVAMAGLAWLWLAYMAHAMHGAGAMSVVGRPHVVPWTAADLGFAFLMWAVMMAAMMLPSATPMIMAFAAVNRGRAPHAGAAPTLVFVAGYLAIWIVFSALAAVAQWRLQRAALLSADGMTAAPWIGGVLLVVAGGYQLTPLKLACLTRCQSPLRFVLTAWRDGALGALRMGLGHGAVCLGCCWALMTLLFVAGIMNLAWVAALAALVLLEKVTSAGRLIGTVAAVLAIGWGGLLLLRAV